MSWSFTRSSALALTLALAAPSYGPACADDYPTRPITAIVQLAAGTGMDTIVRLYGDKLAQRLGQPMVIENRPGGAGHAATDGILKAPADGYTLAVMTSSVMAIRPTMFKKLPY